MYLAKLRDTQNTTEQKNILTEAIKTCPDFYLYYQMLGDILKKENNIEEADKYYKKAVEYNPNLAKLYQKKELSKPENRSASPFCGIYDRYPDKIGKRQFEGGLRVSGEKKKLASNLPLVTIVTAVFNNDKTFQRCIDSVKNQTYPNIEYIVIDGGSNQNTLDIIEKNTDFIDYVISEHDNGIYSAMNKGIELAKGDYVTLLNSDDFYDIDFVSETVHVALKNGSNIVYTDYSAGEAYLSAQKINNGILFGHLNICHNTFLVTKECYNKIGKYSEVFKIVSDAIWMRKAFIEKVQFTVLNKNLFTLSDGGLSSGQSEKTRRLFIDEVINSYKSQFSQLSDVDAEEIYLFRFNKNRIGRIRLISEYP